MHYGFSFGLFSINLPLLLAPFWIGFWISLGSAASVALWIMCDCSYPRMIWQVRQALGWDEYPCFKVSFDTWIKLRPRLVVFGLLTLATGYGVVSLFSFPFNASDRFQQILGDCAVVMTALVWVAVYRRYHFLHYYGMLLRARGAILRIAPVIEFLYCNWPAPGEGELHGIGPYVVREEYPNSAFLEIWWKKPGFPCRIEPAPDVDRTSSGALSVKIESNYEVRLEYHPNGTEPASYQRDSVDAAVLHYKLVFRRRLTDTWFFAIYE